MCRKTMPKGGKLYQRAALIKKVSNNRQIGWPVEERSHGRGRRVRTSCLTALVSSVEI